MVEVGETILEIENEKVYVWATVDINTFEVLQVDVSPGRSNLDALVFLIKVLKCCRGQSVLRAHRGDWYDWPLDLFDWEPKRETWGDRSLIEAWFGVLKLRTMLFRHRFATTVAENPPKAGSQPLPPYNAMLQN